MGCFQSRPATVPSALVPRATPIPAVTPRATDISLRRQRSARDGLAEDLAGPRWRGTGEDRRYRRQSHRESLASSNGPAKVPQESRDRPYTQDGSSPTTRRVLEDHLNPGGHLIALRGILDTLEMYTEDPSTGAKQEQHVTTEVPREVAPASPATAQTGPIQHIPFPTSLIHDLSNDAICEYFCPDLGHSNASMTSDETRLLKEMDYTGKIADIKLVALGAFCDVMKGVISPNGNTVAIKSLRAVDIGSKAEKRDLRLWKRLAREMLLWHNLRHPRILPLLGFATVENRPSLISPWCQKGNLYNYLMHNPNADRKPLILQVAEGLMYLHSRTPTVVHSDIKSLNILIDDTEGAVLCDFGLSKHLGKGPTGLTTSNNNHCSYRYAAVEIVKGGGPSVKSDVYSFACVALEIVTNRVPFYELGETAAVILAISGGEAPFPSNSPALPADHPLCRALRKALHSDAAQRPTMEEAYRELVKVPATSYMDLRNPETDSALSSPMDA